MCNVFASVAPVMQWLAHVELPGSIPGQGEICMENSVSTALPAHSAVMSRPGVLLVEGKATREWLVIILLMPVLEMEGR